MIISPSEGINRIMYYHRGLSVEWPLVWVSIFGPSYCGNQRALQASSVCCCYLVPQFHKIGSLSPYMSSIRLVLFVNIQCTDIAIIM